MGISAIQIRRFLTLCIIAPIIAFLPVTCTKSKLKQRQLLREGPQIVAAIQTLQEINHRYPKELKELKQLPPSAYKEWHYFHYSSEDGDFYLYARTGWLRNSVDCRSEDPSGWFLNNGETGEITRLTPPKP